MAIVWMIKSWLPALPQRGVLLTAIVLRAMLLAGGWTAGNAPAAPDAGIPAVTDIPRPPAGDGLDRWFSAEDHRVTDDIRQHLAGAVLDTDPLNIHIRTQQGEVTLTGFIVNDDERAQIERLVHGTAGVLVLHDALIDGHGGKTRPP